VGRRPPDEPNLRLAALSAAIFIVALFVRVMPMGLYVTPDEPIWVMRSVRFLEAVRGGDWTAVPQTGHPGITTMALGALGVGVTTVLAPDASVAHLDWITKLAWLAPENAEAFRHLAFFLPAVRLLVAVVTSLGVVAVYRLGRRRIGGRAARWTALLLALDPFLAGHSSLLHTDALQATFVLLAAVLLMPHRATPAEASSGARRRQVVSMLLAALCLALAGLTKTLGLLAAPGLAIAVLLWGEGRPRDRLARVGVLTLLTVVLYLGLYPPFWQAPREALTSLIDAVGYHEGIGLRPVAFLGRVRMDPGPLFYPVVLLLRMTPPVFLGTALALFGAGRSRSKARRLLAWGGLAALTVVAALTFPVKKFDRYVLSALVLVVPAAGAWWAEARRSWQRVMLALLLLGWSTVAVLPLHYATPLLGGPWVADGLVPLGWGEASGLAARKANELLPVPASASLLTDNVAGTASLFVGHTKPSAEVAAGCTDVILGSAGAVPSGYEPAAGVSIGGRTLAAIYTAVPHASPSLPLVASGTLPGVSDVLVPSLIAGEGLSSWAAGRLDTGTEFLWVPAHECYPLASTQLTDLLSRAQDAGEIACEPAAPVGGFETSRCRLLTPLKVTEAYGARFAGALDLAAETWSGEVQAPDPLTVHLRWVPRAPLGELEVYLALVTGEGAQQIVWAEGGRRLVSDWGWPAPAWPPDRFIDAKAYLPIPLDLPPATYTLAMSVSGPDGWMGHAQADGSFAGIQAVLGTVTIRPAPYPASQLDALSVADVDWPGLRVVGVGPAHQSSMAGAALDVLLGLERRGGDTVGAVAWGLTCDTGESRTGTLDWSSIDPASWPTGHRYVARFAPRLASDHPGGDCTLFVWSTAPGAAAPKTEHAEVGTVTVVQRARSYALPESPVISVSVFAGEYGELIGADLPEGPRRPGDELPVTLYWRALGPADGDDTVFVHLVDDGDSVINQSDSWPSAGAAPTTTWSDGEIIVDRHLLTVPEGTSAGEYRLYVGLYDAQRGSRQPLRSEGERLEDGRVSLAVVEVR